MKTIRYRGGVATFRIPDGWLELYDLDGGGEFHPDTDDGRSFRINVTTARAPHAVTPATTGALIQRLHPGQSIREIRAGDFCVKQADRVLENDEDVVVHCWRVCNTVPPDHVRVALFTYALPASRQSDPEILDEVETFDREIMTATFALQIGAFPL